MIRKITAVLLFLFFLIPNFAFVGKAGAKTVSCDAQISNKLMFVKDYCKIAVEIKDDISSFLAFMSAGANGCFLSAAINQTSSYTFAAYNSNTYKKIFMYSKDALYSDIAQSVPLLFTLFSTLIISAMLLYIGLLRLFNYLNCIKIKILTVKTDFAF
ncbi:MAG: hypothetical protein LBO62_00530 [Endomicrobium sp.]|jgi:hypothetical protein|nr:hypothetical protein [Endomicrobium sp.]